MTSNYRPSWPGITRRRRARTRLCSGHPHLACCAKGMDAVTSAGMTMELARSRLDNTESLQQRNDTAVDASRLAGKLRVGLFGLEPPAVLLEGQAAHRRDAGDQRNRIGHAFALPLQIELREWIDADASPRHRGRQVPQHCRFLGSRHDGGVERLRCRYTLGFVLS